MQGWFTYQGCSNLVVSTNPHRNHETTTYRLRMSFLRSMQEQVVYHALVSEGLVVPTTTLPLLWTNLEMVAHE